MSEPPLEPRRRWILDDGPFGHLAGCLELHPFDVWIDLRERGWLGVDSFRRLCEMVLKHDQGLPRLPQRAACLLS